MSYVQKKWNIKENGYFTVTLGSYWREYLFYIECGFLFHLYTLAMFPVFPQKKQAMLKQVDKYYICFPGTNESNIK